MSFFMMGGAFMYLILLCAVPMLVAGVLHLIFARKWSLILVTCLVVLPPLVGVVGYLSGRSKVNAAISYAAPQHREELKRVGYQQAGYPLYFGVGSGVVGIVPLAIGEVRRRKKQI
jgi:hypothetical protein